MSWFYFILLICIICIAGIPRAHMLRPMAPNCRCLAHNHDCWPDSQAWKEFNSSIDGRLVKVVPPASPCHDPYFDERACKTVQEEWGDQFWRSNQPGAMQSPNWEADGGKQCLIGTNRSSPCMQGAVPVYAVNVSHYSQVQSAIRFATRHNLRLVVKNTGHDYLGRSTASGAFSIWMHHLKNMTFHKEFVPEGCSSSGEQYSAVTVGAGVQWEELYPQASQRNQVVVGGRCPSVGATGGYPQAAGHGPLSPVFGLGADNILQYQVVTSDGQLLVANSCQNKELFWALRGGGGGTFGVVISATHRTHPAFERVIYASYNFTATDKSSFEDLITKFTELNPYLSDSGWSAYFLVSTQTLLVNFILPNGNVSFAEETFSPLTTYALKLEGVQVSGRLTTYPSYYEWYTKVQLQGEDSLFTSLGPAAAGVPVAMSSRLVPRKTMEEAPRELAKVLISLTQEQRIPMSIVGSLNAGREVAKQRDNAVNPAWRQALWLMALGSGWSENATQAEQKAVTKVLTEVNEPLIKLTPGSGTYVNEADYNEPNWQQSFYGEHYPRLLAIKHAVDPTALFVCHHCVGSEMWSNDLNCRM